MKNIIAIVLVFISISVFSQTQRINFTAPKLYPEGVAYDKGGNRFFVSSVKTGTIGIVDLRGNYKPFYQDKALKSSFGMKVDDKKNRLWVCISDPNYSSYSTPETFKKMARLISIDLNSGKKVSDIDLSKLLPGQHFANDLTFDDKGNIFITDSFSPVIYKVDTGGKASIFCKSDLFKGEDVGLNGIVYHPMGFLLVADDRDGKLFKVDAHSAKVTEVKIKKFFPGADGLLLDDQNNLILVQNKGVDAAFQISSNDQWNSAEVKGATAAEDRFHQPTTAAMQNGKIWLLNSKMDELSDSTKAPSKEFSLQVANFRTVQ